MNNMRYLITEDTGVRSLPKNIKKLNNGKIRFESCIQTADDYNRNRRKYTKPILENGLASVKDRIKEGSFIGELDHPVTDNPSRQVTVLFKEASHRFVETGWDGNKLMATIETLSGTENGRSLAGLVRDDKLPVGFSFRGMGELKEITESGQKYFEIGGPLHVVTWDSVSFPSHKEAQLIQVNENVNKSLMESASMVNYKENNNGMICTSEGICYLPNDFDELVERRVLMLNNKFNLSSHYLNRI